MALAVLQLWTLDLVISSVLFVFSSIYHQTTMIPVRCSIYINPFNTRCSKLLLFEGFSTILV